MEKRAHILIVEDDKDIANAIAIYLEGKDYAVSFAQNGQLALETLKKKTIDLAIVDVMMPVMDGITFVSEARKQYDFAIIMLSAKSEETDKILGLDMGADDYVTKPFKPLELLARIHSHLRRQERLLEKKGTTTETHSIIIGGLEMEHRTHAFFVDGVPVKLTPLEYKILYLLMSHPGHVFSSEDIYEKIWQEKAINTDTIMVHIHKIREKIEIDPKNPRYLKVVWGIGYKIEE